MLKVNLKGNKTKLKKLGFVDSEYYLEYNKYSGWYSGEIVIDKDNLLLTTIHITHADSNAYHVLYELIKQGIVEEVEEI